MDYVGGLGKVTTRWAIAGGGLIKEVDEMVEYLESKFSDKVHPHYVCFEKYLLNFSKINRQKIA